MSAAVSPLTFAEFEQLPYPEAGKQELVNGEVTTMPPPEIRHAEISRAMFVMLFAKFKDRAWHDHTGYRMGRNNWLEPDVSVSWPEQERDEKYLVGAPMIAVEVLSPGEEFDEKLTIYLRHGAREVWMINPRKKTMLVFVNQNGSVFFHEVTDEFRSEAAGGLIIRLEDIFGSKSL